MTISSMYLILLCAFASGIIFITGTEKINESINFAPLNTSAPTPLQIYSGYSRVYSRLVDLGEMTWIRKKKVMLSRNEYALNYLTINNNNKADELS